MTYSRSRVRQVLSVASVLLAVSGVLVVASPGLAMASSSARDRAGRYSDHRLRC